MKKLKLLPFAFLATIIFIFSSCDSISSSSDDSKQTIKTKLEFSEENLTQELIEAANESSISEEKSHIQLKITLKNISTGEKQIITNKISEKDFFCFYTNHILNIKLDNIKDIDNTTIDDVAIEYVTDGCEQEEHFDIYTKSSISNTNNITLTKSDNIEFLGILTGNYANDLEHNKNYLLTSDLEDYGNLTLDGITVKMLMNNHTIKFANNLHTINLNQKTIQGSGEIFYPTLHFYDGTITSSNSTDDVTDSNEGEFINQSSGQLAFFNTTLDNIKLASCSSGGGTLINVASGALVLKNNSKITNISTSSNSNATGYVLIDSLTYTHIDNSTIEIQEGQNILPIWVSNGSVFLNNGAKICNNNTTANDSTMNSACIYVGSGALVALDSNISCNNETLPAVSVNSGTSCYFTNKYTNYNGEIFISTKGPTIKNAAENGIALELSQANAYFGSDAYISTTSITSGTTSTTIYCLANSTRSPHTTITHIDDCSASIKTLDAGQDSAVINAAGKSFNFTDDTQVNEKFPLPEGYSWSYNTETKTATINQPRN